MPQPVSSTSMMILFPSTRADTVVVSPGSEYLRALWIDIDEHLAQLAPVTEYRHKQVGLVIDRGASPPAWHARYT